MNLNLRSKRSRTVLLLYVLLAYVLFQFGWWAYLIYSLHETILIDGPANMVDPEIGHDLLQSKLWMIMGEGAVFISLLLIGFNLIRRSFRKEVALANQQRNFLLSVTHELKTPLAGVKLNLQTIGKRTLTKDQLDRIVGMSEGEIDRLSDLIDNILTATRMDDDSFVIHKAPVDLTSLIQGLVNHQPRKVELNLPDTVVVHSDDAALQIVINNVLSNAYKYGGDGVIRIDMTREESLVYIDISDSGEGLSVAEQKLVFDKFYRVGNENTRKSKGTGLGLFIVHDIMRLLGGQVSFIEPKLGGVTLRLQLPIQE